MRVIHIVCATLFASVYADSVFDCYPGTNGGRYCCVKDHHVCEKQRKGGVSTCYSDATVYCGGCGADCCTYDPDAPTYDDDSESGSKWTSSTNLAGTYCKN
ncbi:hypothetical protein GTA08_BOTSDO03175 [Botryosphaeria dothidea]|uniref:Uncharacterized protein n=1 Tax=Botryosphaeria dothidea TaxID=55169 RepID=A0A8H4NBD4_9PEZI|nr:hypothetical protein GTA08_BOTSDO03175 [Botryosphaeria dothidea]